MSRPIKLCHVTTVHPRGDVRIFHKELVTLGQHYDANMLVADGYSDEISSNIKIMSLPAPRNRLHRFYVSLFRAFFTARSLKADIYHLHDPELLPMGLLLRLDGRHVIYDVHEDLPRDVLRKEWIPGLLRKPLSLCIQLFERVMTRFLSGVVAATPVIEHRFGKFHSRTVTVRNYPKLAEFPAGQDYNRHSRRICYIGVILRDRGLQTILDALVDNNYTLVLAGNFPEPGFEQELRNHPGWQHVDYRGWQDRNGIRQILSECMAGIVTLYPTQAYQESLPVKLFEYMACGLPVIASAFPVWQKIIEQYQCGICVDPHSAQEICQALNEIANNSERSAQMGQGGRKAIEAEFNWEPEAERLLEFYAQITGA